MNSRQSTGAMPDAPNSIRVNFDENEPPALVFNERALPGALVSWAWCQLKALDDLLMAIAVTGREPDVAGAVRAVLVPVINALEFSEQRASELQSGSTAARSSARQGKNRAARKKGRA